MMWAIPGPWKALTCQPDPRPTLESAWTLVSAAAVRRDIYLCAIEAM